MFLIFGLYGSWEAGDGCKMMPQGVGSFSTPGKPNSGNCFLDMSRSDISIFHRHFMWMDQSIWHGNWHPAPLPEPVHVSSVYNLGGADPWKEGPEPWKLGPGPRSPHP